MSRDKFGRFKKGSKPWNKDTKGVMKSNKTSFKKGDMPANLKPVGTIVLRTNIRGKNEKYYYIKVANPNKWELLHRHIWEKEKGEIPKGYLVMFKDNDSLNVDISNLCLIKRSELVKLNSEFSNVDRKLIDTTLNVIKLKNEIRKREIKNEATK